MPLSPSNPTSSPSLTRPQVQIWDSRAGIEAWKLAHKQVMLMGYMWTGSTLEFITPDMYAGTRFTYKGGSNVTTTPLGQRTLYNTCLENEMTASFGANRDRIESSDIRELKAIAKHCARDAF